MFRQRSERGNGQKKERPDDKDDADHEKAECKCIIPQGTEPEGSDFFSPRNPAMAIMAMIGK